jgi:hypothetical protein
LYGLIFTYQAKELDYYSIKPYDLIMVNDVQAVLTGDLVRSTDAGSAAVEKAMATLADAARSVMTWDYIEPTRFTRFRGDGWQMIISDPALALRIALYIFASLRTARAQTDTRISIGIGSISSIGSADLRDASGEAFMISGHGLDKMRGKSRLSVNGETVKGPLKAIALLLEDRATHWSSEQAEAMMHYLQLHSPTLKEIATKIGISAQAVNYRLSGAGGVRIRQALRSWEGALEN